MLEIYKKNPGLGSCGPQVSPGFSGFRLVSTLSTSGFVSFVGFRRVSQGLDIKHVGFREFRRFSQGFAEFRRVSTLSSKVQIGLDDISKKNNKQYIVLSLH